MTQEKRTPNPRDFIKMVQQDAEALGLKANHLLNLYKIDESGKLIENFLKDLLNSMFNLRFRATSGYIVYARNQKEAFSFSPHIDVILIDTLVPNVLFPQEEFKNKVEFVPQEAVVGIIEVKKTLTQKTVRDALSHISNIVQSVNISKGDQTHYFPGGIELRGSRSDIHSNPVLGIVGLESDQNSPYVIEDSEFVDLIFSFDGFFQGITKKGENKFYIGPIIESNKQNSYDYLCLGKSPMNINLFLGYITFLLQRTTGRLFDIHNYYLHESFKKEFEN
ncbi:MAG: hypothetical protein FJX71_00955 [Alphaproteobacteria bacterium]|nr:hypothetical protein [Alphaproteobacteria bacterium]